MIKNATLVSIWTWFVIGFISIFGHVLQILLFVICFPFDRTRKVAGRFFRLMAVAATTLAPSWKFTIVGRYPKKLGPMVVVSNHVSHVDCFLISHLPWEMKWLGKSSLFKIPFLGWAMGLAGDIPVHRGTASSTRNAMKQCARYLKQGMPICIFPEGTRSKTGELQAFKDGAFRLAIDNQVPILPLAVAGTQEALPKHSWRFGSSDAYVIVGEPISTQGLTPEDVETLKHQTRDQIQHLTQQLHQKMAHG